MLNLVFISFAFVAGLVAFFAPCSVVLLPGYIAYYLSSGETKKLGIFEKLYKGLKFSFFTILGFFTVYGIAGILVILFGQFIKGFIPWLAIIFGIALVLIGLLMLLGEHFALSFGFLRIQKETHSLYLFGTAYSVASLGCVFPIFLTILLQAVAGGTFFESVAPLLAYIFGISFVMLVVTVLIIFARNFFSKKLNYILPYFYYISAAVLIIAGIYMIYYQYVLFR